MAENKTRVTYNEAQFATAYCALVNMSKGLAHVDMDEIIRHIRIKTAEDRKNPEMLKGIERLEKLLGGFKTLRSTLKETGVPRMPAMDELLPSEKGEKAG